MKCRRGSANLRTVAALILGLSVGIWLGGFSSPPPVTKPGMQAGSGTAHKMPAGSGTAHKVPTVSGSAHSAHTAHESWTCSMHPQVQRPGPGSCPLCGMDLIPAAKAPSTFDASRLRLTNSAKLLAKIETAPVIRRAATRDVALVGKVAYDETRVETVAARFPGRLDRLFVDYTGVPVKTGDHLASIYSPELRTAQQELLQALRATKDIPGSGRFLRETTKATVAAAREKLRLWGLKSWQVDRIEKSGKLSDRLTIYAQQGGVVVKKHANEGAYVQEGSKIYTLADLSHLWVNLAAYESDLAWVHYGQQVEFETEAYPGEVFSGEISFVHPMLDEATRTVNVRVNVANPDGRLKPGMFVRGHVHAQLGGEGGVRGRDLAGHSVCPMHPEVIEDTPGKCRICEMNLVSAESLGLVARGAGDPLPLVVPASAPLRTGKRALVYVEVSDSEEPTYEAREVRLGHRAGDVYLILSGLNEGERVVVQGAFKVDSAIQLQAGRSMMSLPSEEAAP